MSDEKFEPCTPPDSLFDTNAIAAAVKSETFQMGELIMQDGRLPAFPVEVIRKMQEYLLKELMTRMFFDGKFYVKVGDSQSSPWSVSDMWRKR